MDRIPVLRRLRRSIAACLVSLMLLGTAVPAAADEYSPQWAAHPVRILAYAVHPIGVALDLLIVRPAHWVVTQNRGLSRLFGHEKYER